MVFLKYDILLIFEMCKKIQCRVWITVMIFWGSFVNYMFRSHYQINLLAMMALRNNETVKDFGPRFNWSYDWEQQSISALFYGMTITSLPASFLVNWFGPWHVLFWSTIIMAISSDIIVPIANHVGPEGVFTMRFVVGTMAGLQHPAMHKLVNNWSPKRKKGQFMSCFIGNAFGSILTMPVTSLIIEELGWYWSFYYLTIVAVLFCVALFLLVADYPRNHRWIGQEELEIIEASQEEAVNASSQKGEPPYWSMIASSSFWAVIVAHFGNQFNFYLTLTTVPQFFKRKLKFSLKTTAGIAALLHLMGLLLGWPYGVIRNWLLKRGASKKICGTIFTFVPHILTGFILMYFPKIGDSEVYAVGFLVAMMFFNGVAVASVLGNPEDLTTNWQETIYNTMNFFGNCGGFIGPVLVSKLTEENTIEGWGIVFLSGGVLSILTGIFFRYFAEFEIQDWTEPKRNAQNN